MRFGRLALIILALALPLALAGGASALPCNTCGGGGGGGTPVTTLSLTDAGFGSVADTGTTVCTANTTCQLNYYSTDSANLSAVPDSGYSFVGWNGACTGTGTCTVAMDSDHSVTATFADTTPPPAPTIISPAVNAPPPAGSSQSIGFTRSDGGGATGTAGFRCHVDSSTYSGATPCTSPWGTGALATGTHTVYVWALDVSGNVSTPASRSFKIVNRPDTTISGTPSEGSVTSSPSTAFAYGSSVDGASYECTLDGSPVACNSDLGPAADGAHTFTVAAGISPFGDSVYYYDTTPAVRHWTVDTQAPDTQLSTSPTSPTVATGMAFDFSGTDPAPGTALHYECKLDQGDFGACTTGQSYSDLAVGSHMFSVRAVDAAGNADATPATTTWLVIADADADGFFTNTDCNDANPAVHPGAADTPGNGVDEDCSGADAQVSGSPATSTGPAAGGSGPGGSPVGDSGSGAPAVVAAKLARSFKVSGKGALVKTLKLTGLTPGARVTLSCKGKGCAFKSKRVTPKKGAAILQALFKKKTLNPGAVITIKVVKAGMKGMLFTLTVKKRRQPSLKAASV